MSTTIKKILPIALIVAGALAVIIVTKPVPASVQIAAGEPNGSGILIADAATFDFGSIPLRGGLVTHDYIVRNTGTETVTIRSAYTSCMCTTALVRMNGRTWGPFGMPGHGFGGGMIEAAIAPGETATVEAVFDPAAHGPAGVGPVARSVYLENDAGAPLDLSFNALVTP